MWRRLAAVALLAAPGLAAAHAFPDHSEPRVGIWFDGQLEPVFSTVHVENADRQRVDKRDARVDPSDQTLLEVSLPPLPPGRYRVFWSVVARDGHRTEGDFSFRIR